jgi:hypothetical protein
MDGAHAALRRCPDLAIAKRSLVMKAAFNITVLAVLLVAPSPCFAAWEIVLVSKETAKEMGMEVRLTGRDLVRVQLEFKAEGPFKNLSRVELRLGEGDNPPLTAALQEDRSKPGRVVVRFDADRAHLDKINLWVIVPESLVRITAGGTAYHLRVKDFVELPKGR